MNERRDRMFLFLFAAGACLAAVLLVTHRSTGFRTVTPGAPSGFRAESRGGALPPPTHPADRSARAARPPPAPDALGRVERRTLDLSSRTDEESRRVLRETLAFEADPAARAAACRSLRIAAADDRIVAWLATETDPVAIPAAAAVLARIPGDAAADAFLRLAGRAGPRGYPDLVEEVLARDDVLSPDALVALATACLDPGRAPERGRILARLEDGGEPPAGLSRWASREPDADLRDRLGALLPGERGNAPSPAGNLRSRTEPDGGDR